MDRISVAALADESADRHYWTAAEIRRLTLGRGRCRRIGGLGDAGADDASGAHPRARARARHVRRDLPFDDGRARCPRGCFGAWQTETSLTLRQRLFSVSQRTSAVRPGYN